MTGTLTLNKDGRWKLEAPPHVIIRAKRVFGKIAKNAHGNLYLSDTDENARDLAWFIERYPLDVDPIERLRERAASHREREALVQSFLDRRREPPAFDLAIPARDYQRVAAAILLGSGSLLLADDVGLGKTASAICSFTDPRALPALVVTLTHLPRQWEAEIARFAPKLRVHVIKNGTPYDLTELGARAKGLQLGLPGALPDVIVINYHKLSGWADTLAGVVRSVVFDECQELRTGAKTGRNTPPPAKYTAAEHIAAAASFRCGLSATPIFNYGAEIYSVLSVLRPTAMGTRSEFLAEWCSHGERITDPRAFGTYAREAGLMLRRTRADVGRELPPISRVPHYVDADEGALDKVGSACAELARVILRQGEGHRGEKMMASEELSNKLRQATGIAKAPFVAEFVRLLLESEQKVLLYGWHRDVYSIWLDRLREFKPVMFTGSESASEKQKSRDAFVSGDARVLLMSLRAGAGLDGLQTVCRTVVFGELDWSPGVHEQCVGRIGRDGQTEPVMAYFLIADSGSDPIVADVLGVKRQQIEGLRDPNRDIVEELQVDADHVKRLARDYLTQRGESIPESVTDGQEAAE